MTPPPLPVPKPRARYMRDNLSSASSLDRDVIGETLQPAASNGNEMSTGEGAPPLPLVFPTLDGVTDVIAASIPSLAGFASSIRGHAPTPQAPSAPPSVDGMANSIPSLAGPASAVAKLNAPGAPEPALSLDSIISSLANIPSLAGIVSIVNNPALPPSADKPHPASLLRGGATHTDVGALSQLVMSSLDPGAAAPWPPVEGAAEPPEEGCRRSPAGVQEDRPHVAVLACWASQDDGDTDSSNEEDDTGVDPAPPGADGPMRGEAASNTNVPANPAARLVPKRPAPPPPPAPGQSGKPLKKKTPRAATIRVSRKRGGAPEATPPPGAVVRAGWLDVWKGFRHHVLWATLDGQLMSLWKKRTDRFSEVLFHVSSVTDVKRQDKGRFSVFFRKKHYDFMAHSEEVQRGWVSSLLAARGQPPPPPPELQGPITIRDPRSRAYAALWGHDLWLYPNKQSAQLGLASMSVPLKLSSVRTTGRHAFSLTTPHRAFSLSVDSSRELSVWLEGLSSCIHSALSSSQVALRLWQNPHNTACGDCGAADPEWASVNLLLVICHTCAGQHRALGSNLSKVRSLKMDSKVWTEPLIQLLLCHGNRLANQVWAPAVPAAEQLTPSSSDEERSKFITDKYKRGRYRRVHALSSSPSLMEQRLCQVVCGDDIEETMSLICSGAKVCPSDPQSPSPILLAERAGQAQQTELLRLNEYTDVPPHLGPSGGSAPSVEEGEELHGQLEEGEELHGKLEEDRFLFSLENEAAVCDVLDLRDVLSLFLRDGASPVFEVVTLSDQLLCAADSEEALRTHLVHILKVILPGGVSYAEVGGASAVSKVLVVDGGGASNHCESWLLLLEDEVSLHPVNRLTQQPMRRQLHTLTHHEMDLPENTITMVTADMNVSLRFKEQHSCRSWFSHLQRALANQGSDGRRLYPVVGVASGGSVPRAIERCISHITAFGLEVEGVYRRCGLASKVTRLVEALMTSPDSAPLEHDEQGVLDAGSALKQYVRQQESLLPDAERQPWIHAAMLTDELSRFSEYRRLLRKLPEDNRATLSALFGHLYKVQVYSQVNRMSAQNLALVLVPTLFQTLNPELLLLTREFIIHHELLFLTPEREEEEEQITVF